MRTHAHHQCFRMVMKVKALTCYHQANLISSNQFKSVATKKKEEKNAINQISQYTIRKKVKQYKYLIKLCNYSVLNYKGKQEVLNY